MKIMIDTNIIISAALFPHGRAAEALFKALTPPFEPIICDYVLDELHRKFRQKFPQRQAELESYLFNTLLSVKVILTPSKQLESESLIRDIKDRPILRAAITSNIDLFLTGDKDFLESEIHNPKIISVSEFLKLSPI